MKEPFTPTEQWAVRGLIALTCTWVGFLVWLVNTYA